MFCNLVRFDELGDAGVQRWLQLIDEQPGYQSPFFHPFFTQIVSEERGDIYVIIAGEQDRIDLIWPVQKSGKFADPVGAPFSDYHGPVTASGWSGDLKDILRKVGLNAYHFTTLYDPAHRFEAVAEERDGAFVCNIGVGSDAFFAEQKAMYPRHNKKLRRLSRKVEREVGELTFCFNDLDDDAGWEKVMAWKRRQYKETGRHDVLAPQWVQSMLKRLWKEGVIGCRGKFHTLKHGDRLLAAEFNLTSRTVIHGWIPAFDHEFWSYSPGYLIQDEIIRHAASKGYQEYDLGISMGHYKKYYASFQRPVLLGTLRSGVQMAGSGMTLWHRLEEADLPKLSPLAGKIRRRYNMIRTVETTAGGRMKGIVGAACQMLGSAGAKPEEAPAEQES